MCDVICCKPQMDFVSGDQGRRAEQVRRGRVRPQVRRDREVRGEAARVRLQQDQRRNVHLLPIHSRQDRGVIFFYVTSLKLYRET